MPTNGTTNYLLWNGQFGGTLRWFTTPSNIQSRSSTNFKEKTNEIIGNCADLKRKKGADYYALLKYFTLQVNTKLSNFNWILHQRTHNNNTKWQHIFCYKIDYYLFTPIITSKIENKFYSVGSFFILVRRATSARDWISIAPSKKKYCECYTITLHRHISFICSNLLRFIKMNEKHAA